MPPQPAPPPTRYSALMFLIEKADNTADDFFEIDYTKAQRLRFDFGNIRLTVNKRTYSEAHPENITYEISLGALMPKNSKVFFAYVLSPKGPALNREVYKRCLQELAEKETSEMSQHEA